MMLVILAILASGAWLGLSYVYLQEYYGLENLLLFAPFEQGMILAGVIAPLAAIWALVCALLVLSRFRRIERLLKDASLPRREKNQSDSGRETAPQVKAKEPEAPRAERVRVEAMRAEPRVSAPPAPAVEPPSALPAAPPPLAAPLPPTPPVEAPLPAPNETAPPPTPQPTAEAVTSIAQEVAKALGRLRVQPDAIRSEAFDFDKRLARASRDLNAISMDLTAILCQKRTRDQALAAYNKGDKDAFHRLLSEFISSHQKAQILTRLVQSDAASLLHTFAIRFGDVQDEVRRADASGLLDRRLRDSVIGALASQIEGLTSIGSRAAP